jgi:hypothetical protein
MATPYQGQSSRNRLSSELHRERARLLEMEARILRLNERLLELEARSGRYA